MTLKNTIFSISLGALLVFGIGLIINGCGSVVNTNNNSHFTPDGHLIPETTTPQFQRKIPSSVKFYVEVSGSMNGFFRANRPTDFKSDVWNVLNAFPNLTPQVSILTNDGTQGATLPLKEFQDYMNKGTFVSSQSTKVPKMLQTIIDSLNTNEGEVAVLISDMKYSPVGSAAPEVLMSQYETDISNIIRNFGKAISIICTTSDYLDKSENVISKRSPYYFVILGNQENVAEVRNNISLHLNKTKNFVDNIESGFIYGNPDYSFGIPINCNQFEEEPTFTGATQPCTIRLKIPLENYRWIMTDEEIFKEALKVKTVYGSTFEIDDIKIEVNDVKGAAKELCRVATATVDLKLTFMPSTSEVIEWNLDLPVKDYTLFNEFLEDATNENDPNKSYSVLTFFNGVFQGVTTHDMQPNYILISEK